MEDVVHCCLEGSWAVGKAKKHHEKFKEAMVSAERSLPLISLLHPDVIETPSDIQLSEVLCPAKLFDQLRDKGKWVLVLDRNGIEGSVVLDKSKAAILLFDEEDRGGHWGFGVLIPGSPG
jgi:hypothetical protein